MNDISLPLHKNLRLYSFIPTCMSNMSQTSNNFYLRHQVFACWQQLNRIFFLAEVLFFREPPESPIVGASDIGQVSTAKRSTYFKYFYLLQIEGILQIPSIPSVKDILTLAGIKIKISGKTKTSYQDQDSHQDQVVLQDQVIFLLTR